MYFARYIAGMRKWMFVQCKASACLLCFYITIHEDNNRFVVLAINIVFFLIRNIKV